MLSCDFVVQVFEYRKQGVEGLWSRGLGSALLAYVRAFLQMTKSGCRVCWNI